MQFKEASGVVRDGVRISAFVMGADVSGAIWRPTSTQRRALILAPGGGQDVNAPGIARRAEHFARHGFASAAINPPGQGGRVPKEEYRRLTAQLDTSTGDLTPLTKVTEAASDYVAKHVAPELVDLVDALIARDLVPSDSLSGFWGLSQGAVVGLRLAKQGPRLTAAVLGLAGARHLVAQAREVHIPVQHVVQWDDRLVPP
jgi:pimeloyl-ACP methyl ester carboxylesterase